MYEIKVFDTIYKEELKKDWIYLQNGKDMTAFQHYDWYCMLEEEFKLNKMKKLFGKILYFEVFENGNPVLIAPMHIQRRTFKIGAFGYEKGIYFLGMKGYSDYLNCIYIDITKEIIAFLLNQIVIHTSINHLILTQVKDNTLFKAMLLSTDSFKVCCLGSENCVMLSLPDTYQHFWDGISKNLRSNIKKQINRQKRDDISIEYRLIKGKIGDDSILDRIKHIHEERYHTKNKNNKSLAVLNLINKFRIEFDEIQYSAKNNDDTWLLLGMVEKRIVSYFYGLEDKKAVRIMQLGFIDDYSKYMPGTITFLKYIEDAYPNIGSHSFDFTRGEERYKYELGGKTHIIADYCVEINENH